MNMGIEIKNVSKAFGNTQALDNVSLSLEPGHIYGLLGNNGAGKSTLMGIITNRLYADGGQVLLDGQSTADNDAALRQIFLASEQNLFPEDMRVKRAFQTAALFSPAFDAEKALDLSAQFGLNTKKKITALSTGYATIFRLVMALSLQTPWLLLDEPVLGLDAQHRDLFYRLLLEHYAATGCTILFSTHLIAEAARLIDHAFILRQGKLLRDADTDSLTGGAYTVSGSAAAVDQWLAGRRVLTENALGGLKTVTVEGDRPAAETLPGGLEISGVNLQEYFIGLMEQEDRG